MTDPVSMHSGDYVERYGRKSLTRVANLARRMHAADEADVFDFGCGNGMLLQVLGSRSGRYVGVDFSPDFIAAAGEWARRKELHNYEFKCLPIEEFCSQNLASCDVATAFDLSEHVADEEAVALFAAIRSAIRPGGILYAHTPNRDFLIEQLKEKGLMRQFPEHIAVRSPNEMIEILTAAGFQCKCIKVTPIPHYNILKLMHPLRHLPIVGARFEARLWIEARC